MFLVLAAFVGGMQIATDSTAGERERGSLEPLLVNPVPRIELVAGKWIAAVSASMISMTITLIITSTVLLRLPLEDLGFRFRFSVFDAMLLLAATAPIALIAPALQMYLASFAKSFKEAQSYMGFLIFLPTLPGIASAFYPINDRPWLAPIPVLGQYALSTDIVRGTPPAAPYLILAALAASAFAAIFLSLTARLFAKEKIIFGR
jgi:sodium transport system permease protein